MKKSVRKWIDIIGIIGLLLAIYSIILAVYYHSIYWYGPSVIGGSLFLAWLNYKLNKDSLITRFIKNKRAVILTYFFLVFITVIIEYLGRIILNLWFLPEEYTFIDTVIHVFLIGYPFAMLLVYEFFNLIIDYVKSFTLALLITILFGAFASEVLNTYAWAWTYTIPYINFEILQINVIVIIGWSILVIAPFVIREIISKFKLA